MSYSQLPNTQNNSRVMIGTQSRVPVVVLRYLDTIIEESQQSLEQERSEYNTQTEFDSNEEIDSDEIDCLLLTEIAEKINGDKKLIDLCSFTFLEIVEICEIVKVSILSTSARGKRPK